MADTPLLHHAPMSRSNIAHWMLEELGVPYRLNLLSLERQDQKRPEYLAINPLGKVPALEHKGVVITEAAAICAYLADEYPQAGLSVPAGDARRGLYFRWLFFSPTCLEQAMLDRASDRAPASARTSSYGDYDLVVETVARAVATGPFLLGEQFTAADVVIGSCVRWGTMMKLLPERSEFADYHGRLQQRPGLRRSFAKNQELYAQLHPTG